MTKGKLYWIGIFALAGIITLWFLGKFGREFYVFLKLTAYTEANIESFEVKEITDSRFIPIARYTYSVSGKSYEGKYAFSSKRFHNSFAAEEVIKEWQTKPWRVWYDRKDPSYSSLVKMFPLRAFIKFIISTAVLIYFCILKMYAQRRYD